MMLKPFHVGDYIIEGGGNEGIVQQISVFYTKLATYDNQIILIPNGNLANSSLTNVTDEAERRVDLKVGISYDSDIRRTESSAGNCEEKPVCASGAGDHSQRRRTGRQQCCPCCGSGRRRKTTGRRAIRCWRISNTASMKRASQVHSVSADGCTSGVRDLTCKKIHV